MNLWMLKLVDSRCDYRTAEGLPEIFHADIKVFFFKKRFFNSFFEVTISSVLPP